MNCMVEDDVESVSTLFPCNHKTVFLLDHTPKFGKPSGVCMDPDNSNRSGTMPKKVARKSLWACTVEATMDYCRIVWDLFPHEKLIRVLVSENGSRWLNDWTTSQDQHIYRMFESLMAVGVPDKRDLPTTEQEKRKYSILHGLRPLAESLCVRTEAQQQYLSEAVAGDPPLSNRCRVIIITCLRKTRCIEIFEDIIQEKLGLANQKAVGSDHMQAIDFCHLIIINLYPRMMPVDDTGHPRIMKNEHYMTEVHSVHAGTDLLKKMMELLFSHYNLASTTVTDIPMQEVESASSSVNYNVELVHSAEAHKAILSNPKARQMLLTPSKDMPHNTVMLKCGTLRSKSTTSDLINCVAVHRVTPFVLNTGSTDCLISFLLKGRIVLLEVPRKVECFKGTSYMLSAQGEEVFIHTMNEFQPVLSEIPRCTERNRGRMTDLRIDAFKLLMRRNMLRPMKNQYSIDQQASSSSGSDVEFPIDKALKNLQRETKFCPLTYLSARKDKTEQFKEINMVSSEFNQAVASMENETVSPILGEDETEEMHREQNTTQSDHRDETEQFEEMNMVSSEFNQAVASMENETVPPFLEDREEDTEEIHGEQNATQGNHRDETEQFEEINLVL